MRVLVCDDEPDIRLLYRTAFENAGAKVAVAADGETVVAVALDFQPDLVVLDLKMPRRSGIDAYPGVRAAAPDARIIVVSAHLTLEKFSRLHDLGANECFDQLDFLGRIPALVGAPA
ncbi:MAG TPA: response regulator [Acidimicrobiales bacterium]|nr:response regulator [Acidimicrobiales bacterium]